MNDNEPDRAEGRFEFRPEELIPGLDRYYREIWRFWGDAVAAYARRRGMDVALVIGLVRLPANLRPDECRELGDALARWIHASEPACAFAIEPFGSADLLDSELPKPWSIRLAHYNRGGFGFLSPLCKLFEAKVGERMSLDEAGLKFLEAACETNPDGSGNHRGIPIAAVGEPKFTREQIVASLRAAIPGRLVSDVIVAGRSWNDE